MEERIGALIFFGIILLAIGLVASFYPQTIGGYLVTYPFQNVGIALDVSGIALVALGLLYPSRKTLPPSNQQQPTP